MVTRTEYIFILNLLYMIYRLALLSTSPGYSLIKREKIIEAELKILFGNIDC